MVKIEYHNMMKLAVLAFLKLIYMLALAAGRSETGRNSDIIMRGNLSHVDFFFYV